MQKNKHIAIITDFNDKLGSGHIQRMSSLLSYINNNTDYDITMICKNKPHFLDDELLTKITDDIPENPSLIIRDMRDSSIEEITLLQKHGPVLVIDDMGPGRNIADYAWDILPNPHNGLYRKDLFLYGYSFMKDIQNIDPSMKDIDFSVYIGMKPSQKKIDYLQSLLPEYSVTAYLMSEESLIFTGYNFTKLDMTPLQAMSRSHSLITHFGLTMYEGLLMNLKVFTLNPSEYHSDLCNKILDDYKITNLGTFEKIIASAQKIITDNYEQENNILQTTEYLHEIAQKQCKNFIKALENETCL